MGQAFANLGCQLRHARERKGLTLADVAATTKLGTWALAAVEQEAFHKLPGGIFRRAWVKAYADAVGLDGETFARAYVAQYEPPPAPLPPRAPGWTARNQKSAVAMVALGAACLLLLIAVATGLGSTAPPIGTLQRPSDVEPTAVEDTSPSANLLEAIADPEPRPLRVRVDLSADCWVNAAADGERVIYRLAGSGESILLEASSSVTLHVGDAGAVALTINGVPARSLGEEGQVATVDITTDNYRAMLKAPRRIAAGAEACTDRLMSCVGRPVPGFGGRKGVLGWI